MNQWKQAARRERRKRLNAKDREKFRGRVRETHTLPRAPEPQEGKKAHEMWFPKGEGIWYPQYYGGDKQRPVPDAPWKLGEEPNDDQFHVDIFVSGKRYGSCSVQ